MADTLDWIWTMRTGPLVEALIEHLVGCAMGNGFHVVVEGAALARADPRARGRLPLGDRWGGRAGHQGRAAGSPAWHTARGMMGME
ncbi:hypothetical protein PV703_18090 [Streptomyces sp. ME01-24h]|nr:hypothetical protein [Streptomyces sp. ME19-03-3]MDX3355184.1 hypothetical protein [Streptomyces sp. ME01-24h]